MAVRVRPHHRPGWTAVDAQSASAADRNPALEWATRELEYERQFVRTADGVRQQQSRFDGGPYNTSATASESATAAVILRFCSSGGTQTPVGTDGLILR